ncbi:hypothetical protein [Desulfobacula sp.]|uniref:hypothetical protein n=1 Tax=Desulfobacula sp. TaxID=2593537 RepID=UPI002619105A|nr:hypothetical protein [Desulfobacula sp.]
MFSFFKNRKKKKVAVMEKIALMLDKAQKDFTMDLIKRLSDPDICERKACAEYINEHIVPAIEDLPNPETRKLIRRSIEQFTSELRPPKTPDEICNFDEAMFFYSKRKVLHK